MNQLHTNKELTKILITGISCAGKTTLKERIETRYPNIVTVDLETQKKFPVCENTRVVILVGGYNIKENSHHVDKILFISPPPTKYVHNWCRRGIQTIKKAYRSKEKREMFNARNIRATSKYIFGIIFKSKKEENNCVQHIHNNLSTKATIVHSVDQGLTSIDKWLKDILEFEYSSSTVKQL